MHCRICWGRSGEALIKTQFSPSAVTARLACVRGRTRGSPFHARRQVGQRQFHCGKPPPAAEPRTMAVRRPNCRSTQARQSLEFGRQIAVDLKPYADLDKCRSCPGHFGSFELRNRSQLKQPLALAQAPTAHGRRSVQKARSYEGEKNRTLGGSGCSLPARRPTITFQRGTADSVAVAASVKKPSNCRPSVSRSMLRWIAQTIEGGACQPCDLRGYYRKPGSEMPTLRLGDQKVTKHLDARNRF